MRLLIIYKYKETEMLDRLKQLRKLLGLSQAEFAEAIGLKQSAYSQIEKGNNPLGTIHINSICMAFNVREAWLRSGKEPIFNAPKEEEEVLQLYQKLTGSSQEYLLEMARGLLKLQKEWEEEDARKG